MLAEEEGHHISKVLSALGNPTRFRIVELISESEKPLHIKAVAERLKKDYAATYRHVQVLQNSGLVGIHEVGRSRVLYLKNMDVTTKLIQLAKKTIKKT